MKFFVVLFCSLILSEIAAFVIDKPNDTSFQPNLVAIIAVVFAVFIFVLDKIAIPKDPEAKTSK